MATGICTLPAGDLTPLAGLIRADAKMPSVKIRKKERGRTKGTAQDHNFTVGPATPAPQGDWERSTCRMPLLFFLS